MIFNAASAVSLRVRIIYFICACASISVPETSAVRFLIEEGYPSADARKEALWWVAVPRTGEHELGIAPDTNAYTALTSREEAYDWLKEHAQRYGFILRYPPDKTEITGISNEAWHFRCTGQEASWVIYENGWRLEEYLGQKS